MNNSDEMRPPLSPHIRHDLHQKLSTLHTRNPGRQECFVVVGGGLEHGALEPRALACLLGVYEDRRETFSLAAREPFLCAQLESPRQPLSPFARNSRRMGAAASASPHPPRAPAPVAVDPGQQLDVSHISERIIVSGRPSKRASDLATHRVNEVALSRWLSARTGGHATLLNLSSKNR